MEKLKEALGRAETGGVMFSSCATIGLVFVAAIFMLLLLADLSPYEALGLALLGGLVTGLLGATGLASVVIFPFRHSIGGGVVYGMLMAGCAWWRRDFQHVGMVIVGVVSGFAVFLLLDKGGGLLPHF